MMYGPERAKSKVCTKTSYWCPFQKQLEIQTEKRARHSPQALKCGLLLLVPLQGQRQQPTGVHVPCFTQRGRLRHLTKWTLQHCTLNTSILKLGFRTIEKFRKVGKRLN